MRRREIGPFEAALRQALPPEMIERQDQDELGREALFDTMQREAYSFACVLMQSGATPAPAFSLQGVYNPHYRRVMEYEIPHPAWIVQPADAQRAHKADQDGRYLAISAHQDRLGAFYTAQRLADDRIQLVQGPAEDLMLLTDGWRPPLEKVPVIYQQWRADVRQTEVFYLGPPGRRAR